MNDGYKFEEASTAYGDWVGTASLDNDQLGASIYELTGIDQESWEIIALDIGGGPTMRTVVVAVPRSGVGIPIGQGEISASSFEVDVDPFELLRQIARPLEIRLVSKFARDKTITIDNRDNRH